VRNDHGQKREKKPKIRIVNKKAGIVASALLAMLVIGLVSLSSAPLMRWFGFASEDNSFKMDEISLDAAHNSPNLVMHDHVNIKVFVQESEIAVPASIGIDSSFYKDHTLDSFGTLDPKMAPMHTHSNDGVIHIESTVMRDYTLGEFLDIWGMDIGMTATLIVDGTVVPDYRNHVLKNGQNILLEFT